MQGLMQDVPLTLTSVVDRAASLYRSKSVATKTAQGVHRQSYAELVERIGRQPESVAALVRSEA